MCVCVCGFFVDGIMKKIVKRDIVLLLFRTLALWGYTYLVVTRICWFRRPLAYQESANCRKTICKCGPLKYLVKPEKRRPRGNWMV